MPPRLAQQALGLPAGCLRSSVGLIDIGANLDRYLPRNRPAGASSTTLDLSQGRLGDILRRSCESGTTTVILTGTSLKSSLVAAQMAEASQRQRNDGLPRLYATAGVHPHEAKTWDENVAAQIQKLLESGPANGVISAGECGLDFDRNFSTPEDQARCFRAQLELVRKLGANQPLFLHERAAHKRFLELLLEHEAAGGDLSKCCVHCFTGNAAELQAYVKLGCYIGITGFVCNRNRSGALREALESKLLPPERLMIETDAPFMLPTNIPKAVLDVFTPPAPKAAPSRGRKPRKPRADNEPAFLPYVLEDLAMLMGFDEPQDLAEIVRANTLRFFDLPADDSSTTGQGDDRSASFPESTGGSKAATTAASKEEVPPEPKTNGNPAPSTTGNQLCHFFKRKRGCRFGDSCKFLHED